MSKLGSSVYRFLLSDNRYSECHRPLEIRTVALGIVIINLIRDLLFPE
jgi:hypothetical protein